MISNVLDEAQRRAACAYNAAADLYDASPLSFWNYFGRRTIELLSLPPGSSVLDVCCGTGASALPAAELVGQQGKVIGVDVAKELLELARAKAAQQHLANAQFELGDMLALRFPNESFDAVVCVFGIFFVPDMAMGVRELWRLVRPGGQLAVTTWGPNLFEPANSAFWRSIKDVRAELYKCFNPWDRINDSASLTQILREGGVESPKITAENRRQPINSAEDWWTIILGSGYRGTIEQLNTSERERVKDANLAIIRDAKVSTIETNVLYALATKHCAKPNGRHPMKTDQVLFLNEEEVRQHLRMADLIPTMEKALIDFSAGKVTQPVRSVIKIDPPGGLLGLMPALTPDGLGLKAVTFYPSNAERGIPTHMATIFLVDPETGAPLAIMDGRLITEMRTAAVSAVATRLLAAPDAKSLAILGSGVQAHSHAEALRLIRDFKEIRVWSPNSEHAERFAKEIGAKAMSAEEAVHGADVIVTATNSKMSILRGACLKAGCHVNAVGACRPDWRELDDEAMANVVFVDSREGAMKESGDVILSGAKIYAELGEALAGKVPSRANEITIFKSLGMGMEDIAAAMLVYRAVSA